MGHPSLFFGVHWVLLSSVIQTLEGWRGSFVGKKENGSVEGRTFKVFFGLYGKQGTKLLLKMRCCPSRS